MLAVCSGAHLLTHQPAEGGLSRGDPHSLRRLTLGGGTHPQQVPTLWGLTLGAHLSGVPAPGVSPIQDEDQGLRGPGRRRLWLASASRRGPWLPGSFHPLRRAEGRVVSDIPSSPERPGAAKGTAFPGPCCSSTPPPRQARPAYIFPSCLGTTLMALLGQKSASAQRGALGEARRSPGPAPSRPLARSTRQTGAGRAWCEVGA